METDIILLGILYDDDFYGYEIMKIVKRVMVHISRISTGTLYYKLKNLEKKGLIVSREEQEGNRPKRYRYSIKEKGQKTFLKLAIENITRSHRAYWPLMPSIFFSHLLPVQAVTDSLRERAMKKTLELEMLRETHKHVLKNPYPFHAAMIMKHGIMHIEIDIAWLNELVDLMEAQGSSLENLHITRREWEDFLKSTPTLYEDST